MALFPCITAKLNGNDLEKYLHEKAKGHIDAGMGEKAAYRKAAKDLQEDTLNQIHDVYNQIGLTGYEEPSTPRVSENVKNKFSQIKNKQNAGTSSEEQQQTGNQQGGEPKYARTEQAGSEGAPTGPEGSDSNKRGEGGKEEVTPLKERLEKVRKDLREKAAEEERSIKVAHERAVQLLKKSEPNAPEPAPEEPTIIVPTERELKSAWESNIEALIHPETGLAAVTTRILDEQQPTKDAFLKRMGISIEDYRALDEEGKQKIQDQWVSSPEFKSLQNEDIKPEEETQEPSKNIPQEPDKNIPEVEPEEMDFEKEIKNYKLDEPLGLKKYKDQLKSKKASVTTLEKMGGDNSDAIKMNKQGIANMEAVLKYLEGKKKPIVAEPKIEKPSKIVQRKIRDEKLKKDIDAALDDLFGPSDGVTLTSGGLDPAKVEKAVKVIGLYMKAGVYKFKDIIEDVYAKYGAKAEELFRALKSAYLDYFSSEATDEEAGKMDLNIRQHTFENIVKNIKEEPKKLDGPRDFIDTIKEKIGNKEKLNIISIRKLAAEAGIGHLKDTELQEMTELGIVEMAKDIAKSDKSKEEKYDDIVDLYNSQPTISMRSSERIDKQQYSTPIPMAYLMGQYINEGHPQSVLEPTAGNGMLAFNIPSDKVIANEIDPVRLQMLGEQGFKMVSGNDATKPFPHKVGGVIMNPPFGSSEAKDFDGVPIRGLDEQIIANTLNSLDENGRGAIIMGGHNEYDEKGRLAKDRIFLNYLHNRYNVDDVINVDGSLYAKQGTSFPVRIILIDGKKEVKEGYAPLEDKEANKPVKNWEELQKRFEGIKNEKAKKDIENLFDQAKKIKDGNITEERPSGVQSGVDAERDNGDVIHGGSAEEGKDTKQGTGTSIPSEQDRLLDTTKQESEGKTISDDRGLADDLSGAISDREREFDAANNGDRALDEGTEGISGEPIQEAANKPGGGTSKLPGGDIVPISDRTLNILDEKAKYQPKSQGKSVDTVMPGQMAQETYHTLDAIEKIYGNIDNFVSKELGYKDNDKLFKALSAEQVDAVAIAIHQLKSGQGMIVGDMTGVGKGRIAAAIVRYAVKNGYKPIFLTEKPNLFSDLHRDMVAIGSDDLTPFIVNDKNAANNPDITNEKGEVVHRSFGGSQKKDILYSDRIPNNYDYTVATYSQFRKSMDKPSIKRDFFLRNAQDNILIMDESHNASGESNSGAIFQDLLPNTKGVVFLSATFAKRPDNMPVYAMKTAMSDANMSKEELVAAIQRGGVALQEVVAANLVQSGQMIRRERDFKGVKIHYNVLDEHKENHTATANAFTSVVRDVIDFEKRHIIPLLDDIDSDMAAQQGTAVKTPGTRSAGISNVPFASKTFNLINQMLFAIKAEEIAKAAIQAHKEGYKPVIGFLSTMESFLNSLGVTVGEKLDKADFAMVLKKALDGTMKYTIRDGAGNNIPATLSLSELSPEARTQYDKILKTIRGITSGISISPIDVMTKVLNDAGLRVGEITGRKLYLEIQPDGSSIVKERKERNINKIARGFNNGDEGTDPPIDTVLLNASGATGLSMHSSREFKDQRPRKMISGQLELDINKEVQKRGRVDRTNQVHRAAYEYIVSAIPAEQRLLMMFKQKLKSLDANTTSSQKSKNQLDIEDFLNKYGDEVVTQYLKENTDFNEKIQDPFDFARMDDHDLADVKKVDNAASKVTGRVAILPTNEQEAFYKDIIDAYTSHMNYLKDNNENDLEVKMLPLNATTIGSQEVISGRGTNSPFGMPSTREKVEVDVLTKPMKKAEIDHEVEKSLGGKTPKETKDAILKELDTYSTEFTAKKIQKIEDAYTKEIIPETLARLKAKLVKSGVDSKEIENSLDEAKENLLIAKENKIQRETTKYDNVFSSVEHNIKTFTAGDVYSVPMSTRVDTNTFFSKGIFMGLHIKEGATNKYTPSNIVMRFAVNDSRRIVSVPLSKIDYINAIIANSRYIDNKQDIKDNWDSKISNKTRATRYIITGNLLQAYGTNDGQLVSYTTDTGAIRKGMLLPDSYDAGKQKFRTTISQALTDNDFNGQSRRRITSTDGDVSLDINRGDFTLIVPLSKQRGGKYFLDPKIRDLVVGNDFQQYGGRMEADVNADNIRPLLAQLDSMGVTVENDIDNKNKNYQVKTPENDEVSQMKEVVSDLINEGTTSLKQIQAVAAKELGQNMSAGEKAKLSKLVEDAYNEATKEVKIADTNEQGQPIKNELTTSLAKNINTFVDHVFGKSDTERTVVLKDSDAMRQKAQLLGANKFQGIEVDDMIRYNKALEPYEDENWDIKKIPELYKNGKLDKDLLGGLMMFKAPQYMLFGTEGATEAIDFLKDLNGRLKDSTLADTINFLESQKPFLEDSDKISDTAFAALDKVYKTGQKIDWFSKEASEVLEASSKASSANLLKAKAEVLFTNYINHTYDAIFDKYISNDGENSKVIPQKLLPKSESDEVLPFMNEKGEILGFTHNGKIYLNGEKLNPNTPVHEASHIWTEWAKANDERLYKRGIELINGSDYLAKTKANKFYQEEAAKLPQAEREQYFQHEALAAAIGDKGAQFITEAKRNSFVEWAKSLWDKIGKALGFKGVTAEELQNMTLDEFAKRAAADILKGEPQRSKEPKLKIDADETAAADESGFTSIRKEKLKEEISGAKTLIERRQPKTWSEVYNNALTHVQEMYPKESLYGAMKNRVNYFADKVDRKELYNPTSEDIAVFNVFRAKTGQLINDIEGMESDDPSERNRAIFQYDSLEQDLLNVAKVVNPEGETGRAFGMHQSEVKFDPDYGLKVRRMSFLRAKGGNPLTQEDMAWTEQKWNEQKELMRQEQEIKERGMKDEFTQKLADLEAQFKDQTVKPDRTTKEKTLKQSGKEFADKIRKLKTSGTQVDFTFGTWNLAVDTVAKIVEGGATLAEAIQKLVEDKIVGFKTDKDRGDFENLLVEGLNRPDKKEALDFIRDYAEENGLSDVTKEMVGKGLITHYVNSHIGEVEQKDILNVAYEDLKPELPDLTKKKLIEAYLKEGDYKQDTKEILEGGLEEQKKQLRSIAKLEEDIADLNDFKGIRQRSFPTERERSEYEQELLDEKAEIIKEQKERHNQIIADNKAIENEAQRQLQKVGELTEKRDKLLAGIRDKKAKNPEKIDTPEIEDLKEQVKEANKNLREAEKETNRLKRESQKKKDKLAELDANIKRAEAGQELIKTYRKKPERNIDAEIAAKQKELKKAVQDYSTEEQVQAKLLKQAKENSANKIKEYERKLAEGEYEAPTKPTLTKTDSELLNLRKKESEIEEQFRKKQRELREANKGSIEKLADFARSIYVAFLIGSFKTLSKVGSLAVLRPLSETFTKATLGKIYKTLFPGIGGAALKAGEGSSWREIKKGFEAYFMQKGPSGIEAMSARSEAAYQKADAEYNSYKKDIEALKSANPNIKLPLMEKKLKALEKERKERLLGTMGNLIYQFIGGSSTKDFMTALIHRTNEIERQFGRVEGETLPEPDPSTFKNFAFSELDHINYAFGFVGRSHSALKTFSGRFSFAAGFMARLEAAVNDNVPLSADKVLEIADESYLDWERGKYQQDNLVTRWWNRILSNMDKHNDIVSKFGATALRFDVAITRVPVNILHEAVMEYTLGAARAAILGTKAVKTAKQELAEQGILKGSEGFKEALRQQISQMNPEEAATIVRAFRKGGVGIGMYALSATLLAVHFGIFPHLGQKKKKDEDKLGPTELNPGQVMVGDNKYGEIMSSVIEHIPALWPTFMGLGLVQAYHDEIKKGRTTTQAAASSLYTHLKIVEGSIPQTKIIAGAQEDVVNTMKKRLTDSGVIDKPIPQGYVKSDLSDPSFKYVTDKGVNLPRYIPTNIEVPHSTKKLSELSEGEITQFGNERKIYLKMEIDHLIRAGHAYVSKEGKAAAKISPDHHIRKKLDELSTEQLQEIISSLGGQATEQAKKKLLLHAVH